MQTPGEVSAKTLADQLKPWTSVEIETTMKIIAMGKDADIPRAFTSEVEHYIEAGPSHRFLESRSLNGRALAGLYTHFDDGGASADIMYGGADFKRQTQVQTGKNFWQEKGSDRRQIPSPLLYFFVGRQPLREALLKAEDLGTSECLGRDCRVFLFPKVKWYGFQDHVYHLDKKTSTPLKVESYLDAAARTNHRPVWVWTANSLVTIQGRTIPVQSAMTGLDKEGKPSMTWEFHVDEILFDATYPDSTFQPNFKAGTPIMDAETGKFSYEPPGEVKATGFAKVNAPAKPPTNWSPVLTGGTFLLAIALLVGVGFAWWRRT